jgi:predicted RNA-binding protein with PUA-like domain
VPRRYWLLKTEPETFGWDDLIRSKDRTSMWDGVRNYRARNYMRDEMKIGDGVLFYHSNCKPPHVAGIARVVREGYPDPTQFDPASPYHDPESRPEKPRWYLVDVEAVRKLERPLSLAELKETEGLESMKLVKRGMRLSVQPVTGEEWKIVVALAKKPAP